MKGITKLDQLAYSMIGNVGEGEPPINSLYPDRFTGGSSSGSASAVAGGVADLGIGTDTGGSIRVPAAACGLFGIRPTHSVIDKHGVIPLAQSLDVVGLFTRTADVMATALGVLTGKGMGGTESYLRVLVPADSAPQVDSNLFNLVLRAGDLISSRLNLPAVPVDLVDVFSPSVAELFPRIQGREIWANHHDWIEKNAQYLAEDVRMRLERCKLFSEAPQSEKLADEKMRQEYSKRLGDLVDKSSLLVLPVLPTLMPQRTSSMETQREFRSRSIGLMAPASLSGMPEAVIPFHDRASGITIGVGVLAAKGFDKSLSRILIEVTNHQERTEIS